MLRFDDSVFVEKSSNIRFAQKHACRRPGVVEGTAALMFSAPKAVIFDLDDTLYPEREYAFSGFATVAQAFETELGDPGTTVAEMRRLFRHRTPRSRVRQTHR